LPEHPAVIRVPASELQPDSDLGARLVTRDVGPLSDGEIETALAVGEAVARKLLAAGLIDGAALCLAGATAIVGLRQPQARHERALEHA
jgi:hypothetical protein